MIYKQATADATNLQTVITDAADSVTGFGFCFFCAAVAMATAADVVSATSAVDAAADAARILAAEVGSGFCSFCAAAAMATAEITTAVAAANF